MLVLSRKNGEGLVLRFGTEEVRLNFRCRSSIRVGIDAPKSVRIHRDELPASDGKQPAAKPEGAGDVQ